MFKAGPFILVFVAVALGCSCIVAFKFKDKAKSDFAPNSNMECYDSYLKFKDLFPVWVSQDVEFFYIRCKNNCSTIINSDTKQICKQINESISQERYSSVLGMSWYDLYSGTQLNGISKQYISPDSKSMVFVVRVDTNQPSDDLIRKMRDIESTMSKQYPDYQITATGRLVIIQTQNDASGKGFALANGSGLPFIILLFWYRVGSFRLLILPGIALGTTLIFSYTIGYFIVTITSINIPEFVPEIMLFLSMALSIDYNFFLLTRYQEELKSGASVPEAVRCMLLSSGKVVLVSGILLVICWLALTFFPVFGVNGIGVGSAISIAMAIVMNIVLTPTVLLTFPKFFSSGGFVAGEKIFALCRRSKPEGAIRLLDVPDANDPTLSKPKPSIYTSLAKAVTGNPWNIIIPIVVLSLLVPGVVYLFNAQLMTGINGSTSGSSDVTTDAFTTVVASFRSPVVSTPFALILQNEGTIFTEEYFQSTCKFALQLTNATGLSKYFFAGMTFYPGMECINVLDAKNWTHDHSQNCSTPCALYRYYYPTYTSKDESSSLITITAPFDPFSEDAFRLIKNTRDAIKSFPQPQTGPKIKVWFYHPAMSESDAKDFAFKRFPYVLVPVIALVFITISIRFRAAFIPLKLLFTLAMPVMFVLGSAVWVFQYGILEWTHITAFKKTGGLFWLEPITTVFMLIGLALDYDIFLFERVYELVVKERRNTRESVIEAVTVTGPVISAAGIIMALAFLGMVVGTNKFLNQMGYIMIFGVLMDTYIIRVLLVPSLLSLAGWINFWPRKVEEYEKSTAWGPAHL